MNIPQKVTMVEHLDNDNHWYVVSVTTLKPKEALEQYAKEMGFEDYDVVQDMSGGSVYYLDEEVRAYPIEIGISQL